MFTADLVFGHVSQIVRLELDQFDLVLGLNVRVRFYHVSGLIDRVGSDKFNC